MASLRVSQRKNKQQEMFLFVFLCGAKVVPIPPLLRLFIGLLCQPWMIVMIVEQLVE
jgi:hypothetical protein